MKSINRWLAAALLTAPLVAASGAGTSAHGSGYAVFTHGASSLGQGNAVTAHADDPSAVFYNPALINKLPGTQVQVGTTMIRTSRDFESALTGDEFSADTTTNFPIHLYLTQKINDKWSAGVGVFNPFGLKSEWGSDWEGRYLATESKLTTFNVNPVVSYRITPALSVAAGVDFVFLDAELDRTILTPAGDVSQKFDGDGTGVGFNVGVAWDITKDLTVGVSYRSEVEVDVDGDSTAWSAASGPVIAATLAALNVPGESEITLPQQVTAGIAYRVMEPLIVEVGLRWEGWSEFDELAVDLEGPAPTSVSRRDWDDAWGGNIGMKYRLNPMVSLLAGYVYGSTPVPDGTFDPTIPDADTHIFSVGTDIEYGKYRFSLAYAFQNPEERTKDNDIGSATPVDTRANGEYDTDAHLFGVSLTYRF